MAFAPGLAGPHHPVPTTPVRARGSARRTTTIDTTRPNGLDGLSVIDARGRDLVTGTDGANHIVDSAGLVGRIDPSRVLVDLALNPQPSLHAHATAPEAPDDATLASLVDARVAGGFRAKAATAFPELQRSGSVWFLLLDDLPGANLVSGFAVQHAEALVGGGAMSAGARAHPELILAQADICAGWAAGGTMLDTFRATGELPAPQGPPAPTLERDDDPDAWHETPPLTRHATRRRRRIDVGPTAADGTAAFDVHFRDSHVEATGVEMVVHEYTVWGRVHVETLTITEIGSEARVLPWVECPAAVASASRLVGVSLPDVRQFVRGELTGVSTCTHLNDTLRSVADLDRLLQIRS
jgi:hypothetical protein